MGVGGVGLECAWSLLLWGGGYLHFSIIKSRMAPRINLASVMGCHSWLGVSICCDLGQ